VIKGEPVEAEVWVPFKLITPDQVAMYEQHFK
jgi:inositol transport system substrate-binding protein